MLVVPGILSRMKTAATYGHYQPEQSDWSLGFDLLISTALIAGCFFYHAFPPIAALMCYLVLHRNFCMVNCWHNKIQSSFEKQLRYKTFPLEFQKTIDHIKRANLQISPILFILISYWMTALFYNSSKVIYNTAFKDVSSYLAIGFNITNYTVQFVILLIFASKIPATIFKIKLAVLRATVVQNCVFTDNTRSADISLFISMLDSYKEEVTVAPFGILKLRKGIILVSLGVVVTYELLLVQMLER
ncbi:uncharacterized protein NPIL_483661 [Nephila pilipes]|uniref:Gustatory receptor n=1 Tax=Nephila pilipes TaxID=299642 RepID=A0A8X6QSP6_NEPPI|nr:uncharacterized protein NPIL_483661 [Nephila pilipes]